MILNSDVYLQVEAEVYFALVEKKIVATAVSTS